MGFSRLLFFRTVASAAVAVLALAALSARDLPRRRRSPPSARRASPALPAKAPVATNLASSLALEHVAAITHHPTARSLRVALARNSTCRAPFLVGRLSGRHLARVRWAAVAEDGAAVVGRYDVPSAGVYHLEILLLLCRFDARPFARDGTQVAGFDWALPRGGDAGRVCLEDPARYRITGPDAHVVVWPREGEDEVVGRGWWTYRHPRPGQENATNATNHTATGRLFTRHQPPNCRKPLAKTPRCRNATSLEQYEPYEFMWNDPTTRVLASLSRVISEKERICGVGHSHMRHFQRHFLDVARRYDVPPRAFAWHKAKYWEELTRDFVARLFAANCTRILFAVGQWDGLAGTSFASYETNVAEAVAHAAALNRERPGAPADVFVLANHYNPLGDVKFGCPPRDFRAPPTIDAYNAVARRACAAAAGGACTFLDANAAVIGPMWDAAKDFCHYQRPAAAEVPYVLGAVLGLFDGEGAA